MFDIVFNFVGIAFGGGYARAVPPAAGGSLGAPVQ